MKNERINLVNQTKRLNELEEKNLKWKSGSASMTKSEYTEMEKLRTEVPKLAQALQDQEKVYKDHKKELGALKDTQQELNEKYNTASDYVEKYTKKVDSNTTSTSKQKDAIKGVGEETDKLSGKKATVSINSKGVKKTKEDIKSIHGKTVKVTANAKKGKNFDKTNLVQKVSNDVIYGRGIGEILCNYVALQILFRIYEGKYEVFEVLNIVCKMHPDIINQSRYYFCQKIIDIFGMMVVSDVFDEVCYNGTSRNELLHAAITDTMEQFIEKYDKFMGMNSWRMLNEDIDFYYAAHTNCEYRNIISEISRYKRITNKNLEYNKKRKVI